MKAMYLNMGHPMLKRHVGVDVNPGDVLVKALECLARERFKISCSCILLSFILCTVNMGISMLECGAWSCAL